jgi:hypothetical protein
MESLFERVAPRDDVMSGDLTEAKFAASLEEVAAGTAPDTYQDAGTFFAGTFPSGGLRTLLNEALGRLGGGKPDGASVIRLETSLGGGKTHNLIAQYHAAAGKLPASMAVEFMDPSLHSATGLLERARPLPDTRCLCGGSVSWPIPHGTSGYVSSVAGVAVPVRRSSGRVMRPACRRRLYR